MRLLNTSSHYGWISIFFHWSIAIALLGLFSLGVWMVELDYYSTWYHDAPAIHKSIGILVVIAMLLRFVWHVFNPTPHVYLNTPKLWMQKAILGLHLLFYFLVIAIGASGYFISTAEDQGIAVFDWFEVPAFWTAFDNQADIAGSIHQYLAYLFIALVVIHVLGALKHHFWDKDETLKRIFKPSH